MRERGKRRESSSAYEEERVSVNRGRRRADDELVEDGQRFRNIAGNIEDVVFYEVGPDDRVLYVSPAYEGVYGRSVRSVYDDEPLWLDAVHPEDVSDLRVARAQIRSGEPLDEQYRIVRPDGSVRWVRDRAYPVSERVAGAVGVVQDISEERLLEDELLHAHKMEAVGVLASGVAHDFGNVLHGIMGGTTIALSPSTPPERARAYLQRVLEACRRGSALVTQLMSFSRKQRPNPAPMSLDRLLDESAVLLDRLLGEHIELEVEPNAPMAALLADPGQIEQVLLNLAANARAAMSMGGTLAISTEVVDLPAQPDQPAGEYVRLVVRDDGTGMDETTKERIFDPFYTTKDVGAGTGLGLSTALETVRSLGGHIRVHSELGCGTAFVVDFPRLEGGALVAAPRSRPKIRFRARALLVEDDGLVRIGVRHYLEELGFDTIAAENSADAIAHADMHRDQIDLVVCDVTLPGDNGPRLIQQLRARHTNGFHVLYISAHAPRELLDQEMIARDEPILTKPFERDALEAKLGQMLPPSLRRRASTPSVRIPTIAKVEGQRREEARQHVLIVEDNRGARLALTDHLTDEGYDVEAFGRPSKALAAARGGKRFDVLLVDLNLPEMTGAELVRRLRMDGRRPGVVFMSACRELPAGLRGIHLMKPFDLGQVTAALTTALGERTLASA